MYHEIRYVSSMGFEQCYLLLAFLFVICFTVISTTCFGFHICPVNVDFLHCQRLLKLNVFSEKSFYICVKIFTVFGCDAYPGFNANDN